jgi:hypothetical protein
MRQFSRLLCICVAFGLPPGAVAQGVVSDNDCSISLNPTTLSIPVYGEESVVGTSGAIVIMTADFATQGCSCVEPGDAGFDNPDKIVLVAPAATEIEPFRFNDIDGNAQFEYSLTEADVAAGGGEFKVKVFDSCTIGGVSGDVLVDEAAFDVDFDFTDVPEVPALGTANACVNKSGGLIRIIGAGGTCKSTEYKLLLATPPVAAR